MTCCLIYGLSFLPLNRRTNPTLTYILYSYFKNTYVQNPSTTGHPADIHPILELPRGFSSFAYIEPDEIG